MATLLLILLFIGLLDSTSIAPICIVPLVAILGGRRPIRGTVGLLSGILAVNIPFGVLLLLGLDVITGAIGPSVARIWNQPDPGELVVQIIMGGLLLAFAWRLATRRAAQASSEANDALTPSRAFALGAVLTVVGFPGAVPYLGAIDQILRADAGVALAGVSLIFYNVVFVLPLASLLAVRLIFPTHSEAVCSWVAGFAARRGRQLMALMLLMLGVVLVSDGVGWLFGHPLLPIDEAFAIQGPDVHS